MHRRVLAEHRRHARRDRRGDALHDHGRDDAQQHREQHASDALDYLARAGDEGERGHVHDDVERQFRQPAAKLPAQQLHHARPQRCRDARQHEQRPEHEDQHDDEAQTEARRGPADQFEERPAPARQRQIAQPGQKNARQEHAQIGGIDRAPRVGAPRDGIEQTACPEVHRKQTAAHDEQLFNSQVFSHENNTSKLGY